MVMGDDLAPVMWVLLMRMRTTDMMTTMTMGSDDFMNRLSETVILMMHDDDDDAGAMRVSATCPDTRDPVID